jgi:hypothetical protein
VQLTLILKLKHFQAVGKLALGTEEGYICLFTVTDDGLDFDKVLDKQEGRILCLDWHTDGKQIVTGFKKTDHENTRRNGQLQKRQLAKNINQCLLMTLGLG